MGVATFIYSLNGYFMRCPYCGKMNIMEIIDDNGLWEDGTRKKFSWGRLGDVG